MNIGNLHVKIGGDSKELQAAASQASDKLRELKNTIQSGDDLTFKQLQSDLGMTRAEVEALQNDLGRMTINKLNKEFDRGYDELRALNNEIANYQRMLTTSNNTEFSMGIRRQLDQLTPKTDALRERLRLIRERINELDNARLTRLASSFESPMAAASKFGSKMSSVINSGLKKIKRMAISLLGLRTAWSFLTRAARDYISRDKELSIATQSMIAALGQALAPITKLVVQGMQVLVRWVIIAIAYISTFINTIFGTKIAVNTSIKAMDKYADSASNAANQLAGFDELNTISTPSASTDLAVDFSAFDVSKEMASLGQFTTWLTENKDLIQAVTIAIGGMLAAFMMFDTINSIVKGVSFFIQNPWLIVIMAIIVAIGLLIYYFDDIKSWWNKNGEKITWWITEIGKALLVVGVIAGMVYLGFALIPILIVAVIAIIVAFGKEIIYWLNMGQKFVNDFINNLKTNLLANGQGYLASLLGSFQGLFNGMMTIFKGIINFIQGVFTGNWKQAWEGIKQIFSGVWQSFVSMAKVPINTILGFINLLLSGINAVINGLNAMKFSVPKWVPIIGGSTFSLNIPTVGSVPYLASGAVVSQPTYAMIGEGKYSEAVVPLGQSPQFASMKQDIANAVADALSGNTSEQNTQINIYLDDVLVGNALVNSINRSAKLTGNSVVMV